MYVPRTRSYYENAGLRDQSIKGATHPIHRNSSRLTSRLFRSGLSRQDNLFPAIVLSCHFYISPWTFTGLASYLHQLWLCLIRCSLSLARSRATAHSRGSCRNVVATNHMIARVTAHWASYSAMTYILLARHTQRTAPCRLHPWESISQLGSQYFASSASSAVS